MPTASSRKATDRVNLCAPSKLLTFSGLVCSRYSSAAGSQVEQSCQALFKSALVKVFLQHKHGLVYASGSFQIVDSSFHDYSSQTVFDKLSGLTTGLAVYEDLETLQRGWERPTDFRENARQIVGTTVVFGDEVDLPLADVEAAKRYGWKLAQLDAWEAVVV